MNAWQLALFAYGLILTLVGIGLLARHLWEQRIYREAERRMDEILFRDVGVDWSRTVEPRFLGRRK